MEPIDYNKVAELYDLYVNTDYDHDFFVGEISTRELRVLELASGTGRLSLPLIEAGADLTCVDISQGMLDVLSEKLRAKSLKTRVDCLDISEMDYESEFDLVIFPFQSFMELVGREKQQKGLAAIFRALEPGGKFICTLHNPAIRKQTVDGVLRFVGYFPKDNGTLVVSGFEQGGNPVVNRQQFFEYYNESGGQEWKRILPMEFEFIEKGDFEEMVKNAGFRIVDLYGNYDRSEFDPLRSPVMIWVLEKA